MDEKQRTKILGGALAAIVGVGFVGPAVWNSVMSPVTDARARLAAAESNLEKEELKELELMVARDHIELAQMASLPPNMDDAQRLYQEWITNLAIQCRFTLNSVDRGRKQALPDRYNSVTVDVKAETDLEGLGRFLHLFDQADLVHRLERLTVKSTGTQGNPRMEVTFTANGLSVAGTPARLELFARSELSDALPADATQFTIANAEDFPKKTPFLVRVGTEMIRVKSAEDNLWTVERGIEGSTPVEHAADSVVQHYPVAWDKQDSSFDRYAGLLASSPFTKPTPPHKYEPKLAAVSDRTIAPGEEVSMTAKIDDLNTDIGTPQFDLDSDVDGLAIDPQTGDIKWQTSADTEPGEYKATVLATQKNNDGLKLSKEFTVTVKLPNNAPTLKVPSDVVVVLGREFVQPVIAEDDGPAEKLTFAFDGDTVPDGLAIDATSGVIKWQPPATFTPGEYTVQVKVTDGGDPAKSATAPVTLKVKDDSAVMTYLTGAVSRDGVMEAWFYNRGANKHHKLQIGERLQIDEMDSEVVEIDKRAVELRDEKGLWLLTLGKNLRERELLEAAPSTDVAAEAGASPAGAEAYDEDPPQDAVDSEPVSAESPDAV